MKFVDLEVKLIFLSGYQLNNNMHVWWRKKTYSIFNIEYKKNMFLYLYKQGLLFESGLIILKS